MQGNHTIPQPVLCIFPLDVRHLDSMAPWAKLTTITSHVKGPCSGLGACIHDAQIRAIPPEVDHTRKRAIPCYPL
jgi:hypothetical protein